MILEYNVQVFLNLMLSKFIFTKQLKHIRHILKFQKYCAINSKSILMKNIIVQLSDVILKYFFLNRLYNYICDIYK